MDAQRIPVHLILRPHQVATRGFTRAIQDAGFALTPVQVAAMDAITSRAGIDQSGVAMRIAYDRATIGGVIDRLEQKGFVTRNVSRTDRRARGLAHGCGPAGLSSQPAGCRFGSGRDPVGSRRRGARPVPRVCIQGTRRCVGQNGRRVTSAADCADCGMRNAE